MVRKKSRRRRLRPKTNSLVRVVMRLVSSTISDALKARKEEARVSRSAWAGERVVEASRMYWRRGEMGEEAEEEEERVAEEEGEGRGGDGGPTSVWTEASML